MAPPPITEVTKLLHAYIDLIHEVPHLHEMVEGMRSIADDMSDDAKRLAAMERLKQSSSFKLLLEFLQTIGNIQGSAGPLGVLSGHKEPEGTQIPVSNSGCISSASPVTPSRHASDRGSSSRDDVVRSIPHSMTNVKFFKSQKPQVIDKQESAGGLEEQLGLSGGLGGQSIPGGTFDITTRSASESFGGHAMQTRCSLAREVIQAKPISTRKIRGRPCERCRQQRKKCSLSDSTEKTGSRCALCKAHKKDCIFTSPKKTTRRTRDGRAMSPSSPTYGTEVPTNSYNVASSQGSSSTVTFQAGASDAPLTGTYPDFGMPNFDSDTPIMGDIFQTNLTALHQGWDIHCHNAATASRSILSEGNPDSAICLPDSFTSYSNDPLFTSY